LVSQERIVYEGKLDDGHLPISIVPATGWTKRASEHYLSVVSQNGNVLNLSPAYGPLFGSEYDAEEETRGWLKGRADGGDLWDSRSFIADGRRGSYVIHIGTNSAEYQSPAGDITGSIGGDVHLGFHGAFHPGATDFREITQMLESSSGYIYSHK
jgi:hypothetical protein